LLWIEQDLALAWSEKLGGAAMGGTMQSMVDSNGILTRHNLKNDLSAIE